MAFNEELDMLLKDLTEEANNFKEAENPGEEKEALKDMLDIFMRGTQSVREHIDSIMSAVGIDNSSVNQVKRLLKFLVSAKWKFLLVRVVACF